MPHDIEKIKGALVNLEKNLSIDETNKEWAVNRMIAIEVYLGSVIEVLKEDGRSDQDLIEILNMLTEHVVSKVIGTPKLKKDLH